MHPIPTRAVGVALAAVLALGASIRSGAQVSTSVDSAMNPLDFLPALAGDYIPFDSQIVGRPFHVYVSLPPSYETDPEQVYPVVYVLDGDSLFPILAPTHLFLNIDNGVPEAVVVGIAYGSFDPSINRRGYDFTPAAPDADASRRILFGQSRGGGMVLYSAFTDPDLFWGRIASNPTFDPGRERYFAPPGEASRLDLGLVVTSGSSDMPALREVALEWFSAWEDADNLPWRLHTVTIDGGTHAAYSPDSYRSSILWLFRLDGP